MPDATTERSGPLAGYRVLEIAGIGPGPFCGMMLADMGAEGLRVEQPRSKGFTAMQDMSKDVLLRGRRIVLLDLKNPDSVAAVLDLAAEADVLLEGYRPGVAERLGIGPEACFERNPRLVYARMTG